MARWQQTAVSIRTPSTLTVFTKWSSGSSARIHQPGETIGNLVIWGHGRPGLQGMGTGIDLEHPLRDHSRIIALDGGGRLWNLADLSRLCGRFSPQALVELHGCQVARHHRGQELLRALSDLWGVTVEADNADQPSDRANRYFSGVVWQAYHPEPGQPAQLRMVHAVRHENLAVLQ